jgi:hypothetical protein
LHKNAQKFTKLHIDMFKKLFNDRDHKNHEFANKLWALPLLILRDGG